MSEGGARFVYESRDLGQWLLQLVSEDPEARKAAHKVIMERFYMPGDLESASSEEIEAAPSRFQAAVRDALRQSDFPAGSFVEDLLSLDVALQEAWLQQCKADRTREKEQDKLDEAKLGENPTEAAKRRYLKRICVRFWRDCKRISEEEPHEVFTTGITINFVIDALGRELLPAAELIRLMLGSRDKAHTASDAIARMGRDGLEFYDDMLAGMKRDEPNFYCSRALGAVLHHAPEKTREVLELAGSSEPPMRINAIMTLGYTGRKGTGSFPEVEARIRSELSECTNEREWHALVFALGEIAITTESVALLLGYLGESNKTGPVIDALGRIGKEPELVVPRLIELLDTFEEYDPDCSYHGEHERVIHALRSFGAAAALAVPVLIRHIWTKPQQYYQAGFELAERREPDEEVIKFLGELGPAAKEALPTLLEVREVMRARAAEEPAADKQSIAGDSETEVEPVEDTYLDIAIKNLQRSL